jgi:hypothetical protein
VNRKRFQGHDEGVSECRAKFEQAIGWGFVELGGAGLSGAIRMSDPCLVPMAVQLTDGWLGGRASRENSAHPGASRS